MKSASQCCQGPSAGRTAGARTGNRNCHLERSKDARLSSSALTGQAVSPSGWTTTIGHMQESDVPFDGVALPMHKHRVRGAAVYQSTDDAANEVRHLRGYAEFVSFVEAKRERATDLASDLARLIAFLQASSTDIGGSLSLEASAATFLGNSIAQLRSDAHWQTSEGQPATVGNRYIQFEPSAIIVRLLAGDPGDGEQLATVIREWAGGGGPEEGSIAVHPQPVELADGRAAYVRPPIPETTFYDGEGKLIPYGDRWGISGPSDESYSAESHRERFAPLHAIADSLVDYLRREYDVIVSSDVAHAADLLTPRSDVERAIRLTPARTDAAPLTVVYTRYPGVMIHVGVLHDFAYPTCGCDACDETTDSQADRMERAVLSIAAGGYSEKYPAARPRWTAYVMTAIDGSGSESGHGDVGNIPDARLRAAEDRLGSIPDGWQAWSTDRRDG